MYCGPHFIAAEWGWSIVSQVAMAMKQQSLVYLTLKNCSFHHAASLQSTHFYLTGYFVTSIALPGFCLPSVFEKDADPGQDSAPAGLLAAIWRLLPGARVARELLTPLSLAPMLMLLAETLEPETFVSTKAGGSWEDSVPVNSQFREGGSAGEWNSRDRQLREGYPRKKVTQDEFPGPPSKRERVHRWLGRNFRRDNGALTTRSMWCPHGSCPVPTWASF